MIVHHPVDLRTINRNPYVARPMDTSIAIRSDLGKRELSNRHAPSGVNPGMSLSVKI
jgi:hypothetical protein